MARLTADGLRAATGKHRKITASGAVNHAARQNMVQEIQDIESRAHALGMHVTAHALNRAKNALGWELAGDIEQAAGALATNGRKSR